MSDSNKPTIEDKVESAVDRADAKISLFLDKYGLQIVVGFFVLIVLAVIFHGVL